MNSKGFGRRGWLIQLVAAIGLVVVMSGIAAAATINGTVTNYTGRTGRVFLYLQQQYGGDTGLGVSVPAPAPNTPFAIRGVPNGTYILKAFVDGSGTGRLHPNDPTWSSPGTITINNNNHTVDSNSTVTFNIRPNISPVVPGGAQIIAGDNGAFVFWQQPNDSNGNAIADSYKIYYSTVSNTPSTSPQGVITVPGGDKGDIALFHYTNGTTLNVQVTALVGTTESAASPVATMIINPPAGGVSISGTVGVTGFVPTGSLYVAAAEQGFDGPPSNFAFVTSSIQLSGNSYTISGIVPNKTYVLYPFIDMDGDGKLGAGDIMIPESQAPVVSVGATSVTLPAPVTLIKTNSNRSLTTSHNQDSSSPPYENFQVNIGVRSEVEIPVNVTVTNGPSTNGLTYPIDLGLNSWGEFQSWFNVNTNRPQLTDSYNLNIQYANGAVGPDTVNLPVTAVLDSFATPTAPLGNLSYPMPSPVIYSWNEPASPPPSPFTYSFQVNHQDFWNFNDNMFWNIPSNNTTATPNGLTYANNQRYDWSVTVQDVFGNQAQKSAWFNATSWPAITSFTPTSALPGATVTITGMNFNSTAANNTVNFNCNASAQATTASATQLQVVVPSNACTGHLQVSANGQTGSNSPTQLNVLRTLTVDGFVTGYSTQARISDVTVTVNSALLTKSTTTDTNGYYTINGVPNGTDFTLKFTATGYDPAYTGTINTNTSYMTQNMALFTDGTFTAWNSGNVTTGVIRGRVFDQSNGSGITGVTISASTGTVMSDSGDGKTPVFGTATGANGVFYIKLVPDNTTVTINATKAGYLINPVTAVGHAGAITSVDVPGFPFISVSGTVINSSNSSLVGAKIEQMGTSNNVTSAANGAFSISNIPGGTSFELKMSLDPTYVPVYSGWINSPTSLTLPYSYILFTPAELSGVLGVTTGKGAIIGRVVNSSNPVAAISGATVTASGQSPSYSVRYYDSGTGQFSLTATATDSSGMFLVRDVEDGTNININAAAGANIYGSTFVTTHANAVTEIAVFCNVPWASWGNLQSPGSLTVTTTQTTPSIFGQVYLSGVTNGAPGPAPGLVAELGYGPLGSTPTSTAWAWKTAAYNTKVGSNYEYVTNLSVTTAGLYDYVYRYSYFGGQYTYGDLSGPFSGTPFNPGKLTVTAPSLAISGFVYTAAGAPVLGAAVTVAGNPALTANTAADGSYTINGIPSAQNFQVMASMTGYVTAYSIVFNTTSTNVLGRELVLFTPAEVSDKISPATGAIFGQTILTGGFGTPVDGVTVTIVSSSGQYAVLYDDGTGNYFTGRFTTSSTGKFIISNVADGGTVVLSASKPGWTPTSQKTYVAHANAVTHGNLAGTYTTTTTVTLASGSNPSYYGDPLTFTATVSPSSANGTVQFKLDGVNVGSAVTLVNGSVASAAISSMIPATHTVSAVYSGGSGYTVSTSAGMQQPVVDRVMIGSSGNFLTLQTAINAAFNTNVLLLRDTRFAEDLIVNRTLPFTITLRGGLYSDFTTLGGTTKVRSLKIRQGKVIVNRLVVKPD